MGAYFSLSKLGNRTREKDLRSKREEGNNVQQQSGAVQLGVAGHQEDRRRPGRETKEVQRAWLSAEALGGRRRERRRWRASTGLERRRVSEVDVVDG